MATLLQRRRPEKRGCMVTTEDLEGDGDRRWLLAQEESEFAFGEDRRSCRARVGRLFGSEYNPDFASNAELAVRAAFFVVVVGLPFLTPRDGLPTLDYYMRAGVYTHNVVIFFIYNLYKTTGETLMNVVCGFRGTLLAVVNAWLLYLIFPGGVTESSPGYVFWAGVIDGIAFVLVMLGLNWQTSTVIFAVSTFVYFWMAFLELGEDNFDCPFTPGFRFLGNTGINSLITVGVGGFLCMMVTFVPYPRWSQHEAKFTGKELVHHLPLLWRTMAEYFCEESPNPFHGDQIYRSLDRLSKMTTTMSSYIHNSWYECFGRESWHLVRRTLMALEKVLNESYDRIFSVYSTAAAEEWSAQHAEIVRRLKPSLLATVHEIEVLLHVCFQSAFDGMLSEVEEIAMKKVCASVRKCEAEFTKAFLEAREDLLDHRCEHRRNRQCMEDLLAEHVFALHFSSFVRTTVGFAEDLIAQRHDPSHFPEVAEVPTLSSLWDPAVVADPAHLSWCIRGAAAIFAGFAIGFNGYSELFRPYDASIPCTVSVLLSKFMGSAMVKNLGRIQGVVLGSIIGQIAHAVFDSCEAWSVAAHTACLFLYAVGALFTYYHSTKYSYLGCLLAGFGCGQMMVGGCGMHHLHKTRGYDRISTTVCATSLILAMDVLLSPGRASNFAHASLCQALGHLESALSRHFDPFVPHVRFHKGELHDAIAQAEVMGAEAVHEPRYWRTEWRGAVFSAAVQTSYRIRHSLAAMEYTMAEAWRDGGRKNAIMRTILETPGCDRLREAGRRQVLSAQPLLDIFVHETSSRFQCLSDPVATRSFRLELQEARRALCVELARHPSITRLQREGGRLEEDPICQACVVLGSVASMLDDLRELQHAILRSG